MEEKKKRWRPSLTAYRELEKQVKNEQVLHIHFAKECDRLKSELDSQIDGTSQLVKDCDDWREKYRKVVEDYVPVSKYNDLLAKNTTLEQSNKLMEEELNRVRDANESLGKKCAELSNKLSELLSRGWFARLLNKK